jgi:hypothetical protein
VAVTQQQQLAQQLCFTCAACGKQFRWKPELAGKTVACKCSAKVVVPATAGGVAEPKGGGGGAGAPAPKAAAIAHASAAPGLAAAARSAEVAPRAAGAGAGAAHAGTTTPASPPHKPAAATPPPLPKAAAKAQPDPDAGSAEVGVDDLYALAGAADGAETSDNPGYCCRRCKSPMQPGSVICVDCGTDQRTGKKLATRMADDDDGGAAPPAGAPALAGAGAAAAAAAPLPWGVRRRPADANAGRRFDDENVYFEGGKFRSLYLPLILLAVGLGLSMLWAYLEGGKVVGAALLLFALAGVALDCVLLFIAMLLSVKLFDMGFGAFGPALLKIGAIAIGPGAAGGLVAYAVGGGIGGIMIAAPVSIGLYWVLVSILFDLELVETLMLVSIIYLVQNLVKPFILLAAFSAGGLAADADPFAGDADGDGLDDEAGIVDPAAFGTGSGTRAYLEREMMLKEAEAAAAENAEIERRKAEEEIDDPIIEDAPAPGAGTGAGTGGADGADEGVDEELMEE